MKKKHLAVLSCLAFGVWSVAVARADSRGPFPIVNRDVTGKWTSMVTVAHPAINEPKIVVSLLCDVSGLLTGDAIYIYQTPRLQKLSHTDPVHGECSTGHANFPVLFDGVKLGDNAATDVYFRIDSRFWIDNVTSSYADGEIADQPGGSTELDLMLYRNPGAKPTISP